MKISRFCPATKSFLIVALVLASSLMLGCSGGEDGDHAESPVAQGSFPKLAPGSIITKVDWEGNSPLSTTSKWEVVDQNGAWILVKQGRGMTWFDSRKMRAIEFMEKTE